VPLLRFYLLSPSRPRADGPTGSWGPGPPLARPGIKGRDGSCARRLGPAHASLGKPRHKSARVELCV
jgi:hypothetical protein